MKKQSALDFLTRDDARVRTVVNRHLRSDARFSEVFEEMAIALSAVERAVASHPSGGADASDFQAVAEERRVELLEMIIRADIASHGNQKKRDRT